MASKTWTPRRVRSEEERGGSSSEFIRLDEGQRFTGFPLFDADPAVDDPAYYEYLDHWDNNSRRSIPCCASDDPDAPPCPFCEDGNKPRTRAETLWSVTRDEKGNTLDPPELRIFTFNWNLIKMFTEFRAEGDKFKGISFRVSKVDDRGNHALMPKTEKLTATQIKEALKSKDAPNLEDLVTARLRRAMEGIAVARALDDEDEPETPVANKKKAPAKAKAAEPEGWPTEADELVVTVSEVDSSNFILVDHDEYGTGEKVWGTTELDFTDLEEDDIIAVTYVTDSDDDKVASAFEKIEAPEAGEVDKEEWPDKIVGEEFEVTGEANETEGTMPVRSEDLGLEFILYLLDTVKFDVDDYPVGAKVKITCEKDSSNDYVTTEAPEIVGAAGKGGARKKAAAAGPSKGK